MEDIINNQPLVTVGIVCYNRVEGFKNSLKYVTDQTYKNLEILISQDFHATIDLAEIAAAANDPRVNFVKQPKQLFMYNNFRFLLEKAKGEYFMWVSDDDWFAPEFIEKIMELMVKDPSAAVGHTDFMEVDENNNRISTYPQHLPLLEEFTIGNDVKRIKNYINQFEAFGKPNLIYSIFRTNAVRTQQVIDVLKDCELWGDMLVVMSALTRGKMVVAPYLFRTSTAGNVKSYTQADSVPKVINLFVVYLNVGQIAHLYKKWSRFIYYHFRIVNKSDLGLIQKIALYPTLIKKTVLFYYDLICCNVYLRGYNIFSKIRRKYNLN